MEDNGVFENGVACSKLQIIEGSDLGELKNIKGTGFYSADQNGIQFMWTTVYNMFFYCILIQSCN